MRMGWTRLQMIVADPKYNSREGEWAIASNDDDGILTYLLTHITPSPQVQLTRR